MLPDECYDKVQFSLSDDSGVLRFESFAIPDAPDCRAVEQGLRQYLVGRALADVELPELLRLSCDGGGACIEAVVRAIEVHRRLLLPTSGAS